ncbi:MAG: CPBP family intramembrane metalloprotease [Prevotella sp.]|nr:CPBP family intramembrane metalloprotease [Prevotella sp.]
MNREPVLRGLGIRWKINRWWFVAWLLPALLTAATVGISCLLPGMHFTTESLMMTELLDKINAALPNGKTISPTIFLLAQVANGFIAGITINALFAFGEEIGWRGYLLKQFAGRKFLPTAIIIGAIWGLWHTPLILMGHNFPNHPATGVFVMTVACICLAPIVQFIRLKSGSVIAAAIFHGSFNALGTFVPLFLDRTNDLLSGPMGFAGIVASIVGLAVLHITDRRVLFSTI